MRKAWFDKAISFSCTACGKCCKSNGATRVFVNSKEIENIASVMNISVDAVNKEYITTVLGNDGTELHSLKKHSSKNQCVFLDGNKCSIYGARPTQCRTYPYWPHIMIGEAEWRAEAVSCEGIKLGTDALAVSAVDSEEVALNMLVHQVHNRGRGEDWTYEDAVELIAETASVEPYLILEYLDEFYQSNNSRIVHESPFLRVVDSQCAVLSGSTPKESDSDNNSSSSCNSVAADQGEGAVYSRRMEFIRSPQLAQTEMHLLNGPQLWVAHDDQRLGLVVPEAQLDYRRLHMPVHRVLGSACVQFLQLQHRLQNDHTASASVAVIGAGCCALPSYLLAQGNRHSVVVHAVEPSSEVLQMAETYFGAKFRTEQQALESKKGGVVPHCIGGSEFLLQQRCFDAIIIDAFADEEGDTAATERTPRAPPTSLLDWVSLHTALTPNATKAAGVLLINVYGTVQWQEEVQQRLDSSGLFCRPCVLPASDLLESGLRTSPGVQCLNIVLATAPVEAAEGFSEFRQVLLSPEVL